MSCKHIWKIYALGGLNMTEASSVIFKATVFHVQIQIVVTLVARHCLIAAIKTRLLVILCRIGIISRLVKIRGIYIPLTNSILLSVLYLFWINICDFIKLVPLWIEIVFTVELDSYLLSVCKFTFQDNYYCYYNLYLLIRWVNAIYFIC